MDTKNTSNQIPSSIDTMTIKEALSFDVGQVLFKSHVIIDPAPMPTVPLVPIVIGKKIIKGTKKISEFASKKRRNSK